MYLFLDGHKFTLDNSSNHMVFDGYRLWISTTNQQIEILRLWGNEINPESKSILDLSTHLTDVQYLTYGEGYVYAFDGLTSTSPYSEPFITSFVKIDPASLEVIEKITLPYQAHCYPTFGKFKIWFTTKAPLEDDIDAQYVFTYNTHTKEWSEPTLIPGPKQFKPHKFIYSREDGMWLDAFNYNGIHKFDLDTENYLGTVLTNRKPQAFHVNNDREIVVGGMNGMVTVVDQFTNIPTNMWSTVNETEWLHDDGSYIWCINPTLARTEKDITYTDNYRVMDAGQLDYHIEPFTDSTFKEMTIIPSVTHNTFDGVNVVETSTPQYVALMADTRVYVATNLQNSWDMEEIRNYGLEVQATAMVATGPNKYYGETE